MTTSSKTNMNEDLKKEFDNNFGRGHKVPLIKTINNHDVWNSYEFIASDELWSWIQTAISKAHESGFEEGLEAGMKINREQFKANFLTQKK